MSVPAEIKQAMDKASRLILDALRRQAPVDKDSDTAGQLKKSVKVRPVFTSLSNIGFDISGDLYGTFLDLGTGRYRSKDRKPWNPKPGKGTGGIKPRFWLTVPQKTQDQVNQLLAEAVKKYYKNKSNKNK